MRKVRNKKVIDKISYKSFRANRTRNVIAIIAIALTAMLLPHYLQWESEPQRIFSGRPCVRQVVILMEYSKILRRSSMKS